MTAGVTPSARTAPVRTAAADFNTVLMHLAVAFVNAPLDRLDEEIDLALAKVGEFSDSDRAYLFSYDYDAGTTSNTNEWCAPGTEPMFEHLQDVPLDGLDDWMDAHQQNHKLHVPAVADLPEDGALRAILEPQGILTLITVPLWHDGECLGFVGFDAVRHVKDWHDDEVALLEVLAELFTNAWLRRDRERELMRARAAAEQANVAKSRFLATMSHELRTPMNGILGMSELLLAGGLEPDARSYAEAIHRSGTQLLHLLNDVLDVAKVESGRMDLVAVAFDPGALTRDAVELFATAAQRKDLDQVLTIAADVPAAVVGDPSRIRQIITNLISNAVKFTDAGRVEVSLSWIPSSGSLCWRVRDTGVGIDADSLPRIFDPFTQAQNSASRQFGGTGLGLAIVRELVELMRGEIDVASDPSAGTEFTVVVPAPVATAPTRGEQRPHETAPPAEVDEAPLAGRTILVADDNTVNRMLAEVHLRSLGCEVILAGEGAEAVSMWQQHSQIDAVLMDCLMPVMDGYAATRAIRQAEPAGSRVPIVALTANVMEVDHQACFEAGMDDVLTKPYTRDQLRDQLVGRLRQH